MKNIAVYPGTFDPITFGHVDLIERAAKLFDQVIVAIAASMINKNTLFSLSERIELTTQVLTRQANVKICGFQGLLLDFVKEKSANVILRGLRTVTDFEYEFQLASMNRNLNPSIETLFLMPGEKFMYVSASLVREIAFLGGDVRAFTPPEVIEALGKKFGAQHGTDYHG